MTEVISNGFKTVFVFFLSLISTLFGIMVVITNNPVVSVLFLIGLFFTIAVYLIMLGLEFIGILYLLVYVGAISILFLFILMLINVRVSELLTEGVNSMPLAVIAIITFSFSFNSVLPEYTDSSDIFSNYLTYIYITIINFICSTTGFTANGLSLFNFSIMEAGSVNSTCWDGFIVGINHISSIGNILYSNLFILLLIVSLILLLAMVGTIIITLKREASLKQYVLTSDANAANILCIIWENTIYFVNTARLDTWIETTSKTALNLRCNGVKTICAYGLDYFAKSPESV